MKTKHNQRIYLSPPHLNGNEQEYVQEAFASNWIAPAGPHIHKFEQEIAAYVGVACGAALSSGTAAIHLSLKALNVKQNDTVFCSALTFSGSCNPILYEKAEPVFIDSEPDSWNMSPEALAAAFEWAKRENRMPRAVIVVNLYGQCADYEKLLPICQQYGVPVIEDAAESLGALYQGKQSGVFGNLGVISFNGNKIITTSGGGMVVSNDKNAIEKIRFWSTQSREPSRHYQHKEVGYNYRLSNICAAIGRAQLVTLEERIVKRRTIFQQYRKAFRDLPVRMMPVPVYSQPNHWLSALTIEPGAPVTPDQLIDALESGNMEARPVWKPMQLQPVFDGCRFFPHPAKPENPGCHGTSISETLFKNGICLPSGTGLTEAEQHRVIEAFRKPFLSHISKR